MKIENILFAIIISLIIIAEIEYRPARTLMGL